MVESAGEIPVLPRGESPFVIDTQFDENACGCPVAQEIAILGGEGVVTMLMAEHTSSSRRVFFRFRLALLLSLLLPEAVDLGRVPGALLTVVLGRVGWKSATNKGASSL